MKDVLESPAEWRYLRSANSDYGFPIVVAGRSQNCQRPEASKGHSISVVHIYTPMRSWGIGYNHSRTLTALNEHQAARAMSADSNEPPVKRTILTRIPIPDFPGWESRTLMLDYAPGAASPPHVHPTAGANYVVEGTVLSQWENGEVERYSVGETFIDHAGLVHSRVTNASSTERLKIVVTYVILVDEANVKFVDDVASGQQA